MSHLEQLKAALSATIKLTRSETFTTRHSTEEQEFYRGYIRELNEEINAEYEAMDFVRRRDEDKEHHEAL
jgi:hypothetical protein